MALASGAWTKHGFPRGYRFVPGQEELAQLLTDLLDGQPPPPPVAELFHRVRILDHHARELYELYKKYEESGFIYFVSDLEFQHPSGKKISDADAGTSSRNTRPTRAGRSGTWKPSGGAKLLRMPPKSRTGPVVGKMVTMVFYERNGGRLDKTNWGMNEFTVPVAPPDKARRQGVIDPDLQFSKTAIYRLYRVKNSANAQNQRQATRSREPVHALAVPQHHLLPAAAVPQHHQYMPIAAVPQHHLMPAAAVPQHHQYMPTVAVPHQQHHVLSTSSAGTSAAAGLAFADAASTSQAATLCDMPVDEDVLNNDFDDSLLLGSDIAFTIEELTGTDDPSREDATNQQGQGLVVRSMR